jgi:biotin synthase
LNKFETIDAIVHKEEMDKSDIVYLLSLSQPDEISYLGKIANGIKKQYVSNITYLRGLIEFSNICEKDCLYCGIRKNIDTVIRYLICREEIIEAARFAWKNSYGSIVLQSGEQKNTPFVEFVGQIVSEIKQMSKNELGITLSCGEQSYETYKNFFECGAHRYLLRIETTNENLYESIHPKNSAHSFQKRMQCLYDLKKIGYQVGTGIMIGLPFQTIECIAEDLLFFKKFDVDMVGMGPYIEHSQTPLYKYRNQLATPNERFLLTLKAIAVLRIMMKDINIASATALQTLDIMGREKALKMGANIIMPNITPKMYRNNYLLYEDKPCIDEDAEQCKGCLEIRIKMAGDEIGYDQWGDSIHYKNNNQN